MAVGSKNAAGTVVINLVMDNRKGAKGRPSSMGMPFVQLCREAAVGHTAGRHTPWGLFPTDCWEKGLDRRRIDTCSLKSG